MKPILPDWPAPANVRALMTTRAGGVSAAPWASLNLGDHVNDDPAHVAANRALLGAHLPGQPAWLKQVHSARVVEAGRGGRYTYHGPGQRVGYVLLDLKRRARDVRGFVHAMEGWVIATLADFGVESWRSEGRVGIWTRDIDGREAKIGAIGVRIRRWVTMHGFSVNLAPDLSHFGGIVPCGIEEFGVTSLARLGQEVDSATWDRALLARANEFLAMLDKPCPPETDR